MLETEFHPWTRGKWMLRCVDIRPETHDVKTFSFRTEHNGKPVLFLHKPGQFVTIRLAHEGQLVPRSYTIASSPSQPFTLQMTTKRDPNGLVSRFMHDHFSVGDLLPVYDHLHRALDAVPEEQRGANSALLEGVELTLRELGNVFGKHGITVLRPEIGTKFDPELHEAMFEAPLPNTKAGDIIQLMDPGFLLHDRLLRPAKVGVSSNTGA